MNSRKNDFQSNQSAINNLNAGKNIAIGDVFQSNQTIRIRSHYYSHTKTIIQQFKQKKSRIRQQYEADKQQNCEHLHSQLREYCEELMEQLDEIKRSEVDSYRKSRQVRLEEAKQDISNVKGTVRRLEKILHPGVNEMKIIQVLENDLQNNFRGDTYTRVETIKEEYESLQEKLEENFEQEIREIERIRDTGFYQYELINKINEDGYPLTRESKIYLVRISSDFDLDESTIEEIEKEIIEPFYENSLQNYEKAYEQKLEQEGFPLDYESLTELEELVESLGLTEYCFEHLNVNDVQRQVVRPFYKTNFLEYKRVYAQKLKQEGFALSYDSIAELKQLENSLGLLSFSFSDLNLKVAKESLLKPYYEDNLKKYEQTYKRTLQEKGFPLTPSNVENLNNFKEFLCLKDSHLVLLGLKDTFLPEAESKDLEKVVRRPFYHENIKKYEKAYREKVKSEEDIFTNNAQSTISDLQKALGILDEDARIVEALIGRNFGVEHFIEKYYDLRELLADGDWQKADEQTRNIILETSGRKSGGKLDKQAIQSFPSKDSYTIDRLWVEYSRGRFGLSIQKKIFKNANQKKQPFGEAIGWSNKAGLFRGFFAWKTYSELTFEIDAPEGHLPVWGAKDKSIFTDYFLHLKTWNFGESDSESGDEATESESSQSSTTNILAQSFKKIFESINQFDIKNKVDKMGIDGFINQCAILAATTGAASGFGGFATMIVGVPFDVINTVLQQFRVTLGVIYHKKGIYKVSFNELMRIVGISIGVEVGATLTRSVVISITNKILVRLSASAAGKAVPFLGAAIGGSVNYGFVKAMGAAVKRVDMTTFKFQAGE